MQAYFSWVLRNQYAVMVAIAIATVGSVWSVSNAIVASSIGEMFFGDDAEYVQYLEHIEEFGSDEVFAIAYDEADPLSREALDRLESIVAAIESDPEVRKTTSLLNLDRIQSSDGGLVVEPYTDAARADPEGRAALLAEIQRDPILRKTVLGESGGSAAVLVELTVDPNRSGEDGPRIVNHALDAFAEHGYPPSSVHRAGFPAILTELIVQTHYAFKTILPVVMLVLTLVVTLLFRTALPVVLSMGVSTLSVLWCMGIAAAVNSRLSIFYGMIPSVVTVVAVSDVIHMWSAYLHELQHGRSKREAILASAEDVGRACLLTSVTTFVGFVSISLIPTPMFRELGWVLGLGVSIALILAMTLVPIAANLGATPDVRQINLSNPIARIVDQIVGASARVSTRQPRLVVGLFALVSAVCAFSANQHTIETHLLNRLDEANVVQVDNAFFEREYAATQSLDVFITADEPGRILDAEVIAGLAAYEAELESLPEVDQVVSLVDVLKRIHQTLGGEGDLPTTNETIAQELLLFELGGGQATDPVVNFDRSAAHLSLRVSEYRMRSTHELAERIETMAHRHLPEGLQVKSTGMIALMGEWLDQIVTGQRNGVVASIVGITILMVIGLKSASIGLISVVPNLFPLVATTALCGWIWGDIDSDTLVVLMMAIGIGVDDTIHFLMRFRIESERASSPDEAIAQTFKFAGRAIVMTTLILALGFLPMTMSAYYSIEVVGILLPFSLFMAMLADLLLVPSLAELGWLKYRPSGRSVGT
ncbi:MAG: efflux RND transporter permease subunit [Myxococcota bacterium]|nr:efflux RND transporter permease subunit [Myxococcota bacterium]